MSITAEAQVARHKMRDIARAMMAGALSFIDGARQINELRWSANLQEFDPDILPFVGIDSETDAFPIGDIREHWKKKSLVKLQPEIDRAEQWAQQIGMEACQKLIDRFGGDSRSASND